MVIPAPIIQSLHIQQLQPYGVALHVKRDDLIDPVVSGNKLFKLHHHLTAFTQANKKTLITFGGAFSNHLHATAYMGKQLGMQTVGFVRAEPSELESLTPTLRDCENWGMQLEGVSRSEYKLKQQSALIMAKAMDYPDVYWVPEGGAGELGVRGAELILNGVDQSQYDVTVLACGTGTTLAGVIRAAQPSLHVIGVPVLKGASWMQKEVEPYLSSDMNNWSLQLDYHFSGYAKWNQALTDFMQDITQQTQLPLDKVYTGKALYALVDLVKLGKIKQGSRILFIHTGGLQGMRLV